MGRNGRQSPRRPRIAMRHAAATPDEAAAIAAAIEQFLCDTTREAAPARALGGWARTGLLGASGLEPGGPTPWGDPQPWGR